MIGIKVSGVESCTCQASTLPPQVMRVMLHCGHGTSMWTDVLAHKRLRINFFFSETVQV